MPVSGRDRFLTLALLAVALFVAVDPAIAQVGPFGVAAPEAGGGVASGGLFGWIAAQQSTFYRGLTAGLKAMRSDPNAAWWLVGLSFAYGIFHAAGPGHGKAVITSYVLADGETLKRGIALAFVSAFVQGLVAIVFVGVSIRLFRWTALAMTDATLVLERTSAAAILALGLWLSWQKIVRPFLRRAPAVVAATPAPVAEMRIGAPSRPAGLGAMRSTGLGAAAFAAEPAMSAAAPASAGATRFVVDPCGCGENHIADPTTLGGPFDWKRAIAAVAAVGIRPCTGALIVLVFAFAQGLTGAGVLAVFAMAIGTGATVAALATLAVAARGVALKLAGPESPWERRILRGAEIGGALMVLAVGILFAGAALVGTSTGG
jgi:nickel/cobalt exporter